MSTDPTDRCIIGLPRKWFDGIVITVVSALLIGGFVMVQAKQVKDSQQDQSIEFLNVTTKEGFDRIEKNQDKSQAKLDWLIEHMKGG